jgi:multidrug efflux system outer membrane protein
VDFLITNLATVAAVPNIPPSLPSELLEHRPDIAAAERRMAAANADVGVAKAAFFPTVRIDGLAGFQSINSSTWFNWPSRFWSVGPSLQLPLFTGGANRAQLAATHAAYDENGRRLPPDRADAFGEVEDELAAQRLLADEWNAENEAVRSARTRRWNRQQSLQIRLGDLSRRGHGANRLNQERNAVQLQGARLITTINLIKALGCGWQPSSEVPPVRPGDRQP